jgi:hypothetical protein
MHLSPKWILHVLLGLGDGLGEVDDDDGRGVLLGEDDGADDEVLGCELVDELEAWLDDVGDGAGDPLPPLPDGCPVFVGTGFFAPTAVGAPGFAAVPVFLTAGSFPVSWPIGMPLMGTPRR